MKSPEKMNNTQLMKWLEKTRASITNRPLSMSSSHQRGRELCYRYELLAEEARDRHSGLLWYEYCDKNGSCENHDAWDLFA